jgi:hypothetical protein
LSTHKALGNDDYNIEAYVAYASQSFTIVSGSGDNPSGLTLSIANEPPDDWILTEQKGILNESGIYSHILFKSIQHLFYTQGVKIYYNKPVEQSTVYVPTGSIYVLSAATSVYGDRIKHNSVKLHLNNLPTYIYDEPSTISQMGYLKVSGSGDVIGNIFYESGIFVIKTNNALNVVDSDGIRLQVEDSLSVEFSSTVTIYKHKVICQIEPNEFNVAWFNPTLLAVYASGSGTGSGQDFYDKVADGSITPYVSEIGLYNDEYQLLAVAKLSSPIKRSFLTKQTFVIEFDTN